MRQDEQDRIFHATLNEHGLYDPFHFVMRLSPVNHRLLSNHSAGLYTGNEIGIDVLSAFSTALHETIHWWQHVGSTAGFLSSLTYPVQSHVNHGYLKRLTEKLGPQKSIKNIAENATGSGGSETIPGMAHSVINNCFDIDAFQKIIHNQKSAERLIQEPQFENVGWSFQIGYGNILSLLAQTVDPSYIALPDPRPREEEFQKLKQQKTKNYYYGSPVIISPIGTREIFEGQARFSQMQYLYWGSGRKLNWDDFQAKGMLSELYMKAFNTFLEFTGLSRPSSIESWIVGLFLLVCDIAINPGAGFPLPIIFYEAFVDDVNPGMRFLSLCWVIKTNPQQFENSVLLYDKAEYEQLSNILTAPLMLDNPQKISATIASWAEASDQFKQLMLQYQTFDYEPFNLPTAVLLSHCIAFNLDKVKRPEFFCWPGAWMAGPHACDEGLMLFERHKAIFVDKADDDGIFPRLYRDKDMKLVQKTFEIFYQAILTYDLTAQWMTQSGNFVYNHQWLSSTADPSNLKAFANESFKVCHHVHPDDFKILSSV